MSIPIDDLKLIYEHTFRTRAEYMDNSCRGKCCCDCLKEKLCERSLEIEKIVKKVLSRKEIDEIGCRVHSEIRGKR